jgi:hypothetical protein
MSRSEKGQDQQLMTTAKQSQRSSSALVGETHNAGKPQNAKLKIGMKQHARENKEMVFAANTSNRAVSESIGPQL